MVRKPTNFDWVGFTPEQRHLLARIDFYGNNAWDRNEQTVRVMPVLLAECETLGVTLARLKEAMAVIGYERHALHQLDHWESKRTTGRLGR